MSMVETTEEDILLVPRVQEPPTPGGPPPEAMIVSWKSAQDWAFLKIARAFVKANPEDKANRRIYNRLLQAYIAGSD